MSTASRVVAALLSLILMPLMLLTAAPGTAHADTNPATIDPARTGSLVINKRLNPTSTTPGNGLPATDVSGTPLAGVTFEARQIPGVDLTTQTGWSTLEAMDLQAAQSAVSGVTPASRVVTAEGTGQATMSGLALGAYVVHEVLSAEQLAQGITPSPDFVVTLPMTHPTSPDQWLYEVNVYPKNASSSITKTVDDASATTLGSQISWTILADVPGLNATDGYKITDQIDPRLSFVQASMDLDSGSIHLVAGQDYTAELPTATTPMTFTVTPQGLETLWAAKQATPSVRVLVSVDTTVTATDAPLGDGLISNNATLYPSSATTGIAVAADAVPLTEWGDIRVTKTNQSNTVLPGAEFALYGTEADAKAGTNALASNGTSRWTTDDQGVATISAVRYSTFANGSTVTAADSSYHDYWIVETAAPDGYELAGAPIKVTVDERTEQLSVDNAKGNAGFVLPLTGGVGTLLFLVVGAGLVTAAAALGMRSRRRAARAV